MAHRKAIRNGDALACFCGGRTLVIDSRPDATGKSIYRRRQCEGCGKRISTRESEVHPLSGSKRRNGDNLARQLRKKSKELDQLADAITQVFGTSEEVQP